MHTQLTPGARAFGFLMAKALGILLMVALCAATLGSVFKSCSRSSDIGSSVSPQGVTMHAQPVYQAMATPAVTDSAPAPAPRVSRTVVETTPPSEVSAEPPGYDYIAHPGPFPQPSTGGPTDPLFSPPLPPISTPRREPLPQPIERARVIVPVPIVVPPEREQHDIRRAPQPVPPRSRAAPPSTQPERRNQPKVVQAGHRRSDDEPPKRAPIMPQKDRVIDPPPANPKRPRSDPPPKDRPADAKGTQGKRGS